MMTRILALVTMLMFTAVSRAGTQPNFLIFLADDCSYHDIGCYGSKQVRTPYIDGLAREGMRFEYSFNSAPMCAPTRMSLYTGIHPVRNGAHPNHSRVHDSIQSFPHLLRPLGYTVALIGKKHVAPTENFPFDDLGGRAHDAGEGIDLELGVIDTFMSDNKDTPWFLVVASNQPHGPWNRGDASAYPVDDLVLPPYLVDTPETRAELAAYYAEVTYLDGQVGACLDSLRRHGLERNTVVVFLSEQGSSFPHCKWTCYETGLRSAQIVRWPGRVTAGTTTEAIVQYVDLLPTCIELAGGDPTTLDLDGRSFAGVLEGRATRHRDHAFGVQTSRGIMAGPEAYGIRTVRDTRFRLIWNLNSKNRFQNAVSEHSGFYQSWKRLADAGDEAAREQYDRYQVRPEFELYDLTQDPYEMTNLAEDPEYASTIAELKRELEAWMKQQGDEGAATEGAALDRMAAWWTEKNKS
jgi:uncharacterized sulfatase